jgi:hypothetical protein
MRPGLAPRCRRTNSPGGSPSPSLWGGGTVRCGRCQSRDAVPPAPVRLTRRALEGGAGCTLNLLSCDLTGLGGGARPVGRHPCHCLQYGCRPLAYERTPGAVATTPALWSVWERDATLPAAVPRTDRRQQLRRAYLKTSQPSAALLPSRTPLFGYKIRHDGRIAARIAWAAAYSTA